MGVSVSASTAIIVAGLFFAFTAFSPVAANGFDRVTDARHDVNERALERQNTDVAVASATPSEGADGEDDELVVEAINHGAVGLVVSDTTLVVDNEYVDLADVTTAVHDRGEETGGTDLWLSGETLTITIVDEDLDSGSVSEADRVVLVTESGVRDVAVVGTGEEGS